MKLTKGLISRKDALKVSKNYVAYMDGDYGHMDSVMDKFCKLKRGQDVITFVDGQFLKAKVSSVNFKAMHPEADGPVVRVSNGEYSWRVDGAGYAYPL
jgi:hypothetical protein